MATKKIEFNPLLLSGGPSKTKKNRTPKAAPQINPNILKNKLLKRIKEHKNKEQSELKQAASNEAKTRKQTSSLKEGSSKSYTDDFNDSIEYLEALSKKTKEREKTISPSTNHGIHNAKNSTNNTESTYLSSPYVNLDLPEELMETIPPPPFILPSAPVEMIQPVLPSIIPPPPITVQVQDPPWGVLKNGSKPTYRQFNTHNTTMKIHPSPSHTNQIVPSASLSSSFAERENKLEELKAKLQTNPSPSSFFNNQNHNIHDNETDLMNSNEIHTIQRTIKRKYSIGKHKNKRSVGVLLKNRDSRKNAVKTQKLWKQEPVSEMKKYLRKHNLLKVGSFAPTEVVKKLYESAMLAGDVINSNKDTMIHNFVKDNEESPF